MVINEALQWVVLGVLLYRAVKLKRTMVLLLEFFAAMSKLLQTIKDELDGNESN